MVRTDPTPAHMRLNLFAPRLVKRLTSDAGLSAASCNPQVLARTGYAGPKCDETVLGINVKVAEWDSPAYADARAQFETAKKKRGDYGTAAGFVVNVNTHSLLLSPVLVSLTFFSSCTPTVSLRIL